MSTELGLTIAELLLIIVTAVAATGGGILVILPRLKNDPAFVSAIEKLGESVPKETAVALVELAKAVQTSATIVEEAFDGIPAESKSGFVASGASGDGTVTWNNAAITHIPDELAEKHPEAVLTSDYVAEQQDN